MSFEKTNKAEICRIVDRENFRSKTVTIEFINPKFAIPCREIQNSKLSKRLIIRFSVAGKPMAEISYGYYNFETFEFVKDGTGSCFEDNSIIGWAYA